MSSLVEAPEDPRPPHVIEDAEQRRKTEEAKVEAEAAERQRLALLGRRLTRADLKSLPEIEPLVDGVISRRSSVVVVGATGVGKTFFCLSLACSVATGEPWLGRDVHQTPVLYVVGEGAYGLDDRIEAWEHAWNRKVNEDHVTFYVQPSSLINLGTWQALTDEALSKGAGLVILDTFSSLAPDADETKDAPIITRRMSDLATDIDGTVVIVHHPGWSDATRTRGGYQLEANPDEVIVLTGVADSDLITAKRKKVKEGPAGEILWLRRKPSSRSLVIEHARPDDAAAPLRDRILSLLDNYGDLGATGPQLLEEIDGAPRSSFYRTLGALVDDGVAAKRGKGNATRYRRLDVDQEEQ